ncbi:ribonuclease H-like domain-containing protein [Bacillus thermotolerans]|uniref:ribonuclease H-like domain-containing protein n=1 Tax=Bacillus thermotolerans TaxID=1221996 RepID=UPI00057EFA4C|nr:ribonuclease H-like domain-containing protein [Bacillus thermotolerans]KKB38370.1 putative exonuclease [Bacillus thermotolerans]KKB38497.1 putative exonuclease [Bacillus thermotolerans]
MGLSKKLQRMKRHIIREEAEKDPTDIPSFDSLELPFKEEWEKAGVKPYVLDDQFCLIREVRYPLSYKHGRHQFEEVEQAVHKWNEWEGQHPLSAKGLSASELFFFDTETTGLGGGTGNVIFLLGYARIQGEEVVLRQHFLPGPGNETALYASFLERVDYKTLVTYNGKSFDWPQVKTRHTLVRDHVPKLPEFGHFDLYHASRRLWKRSMERVKLVNVEKEKLDIKRSEDVPGYLAPIIYFDFIERKHPEGILKVMQHNEWDILTLMTLYTHLSFRVLEEEAEASSAEKLEVAKWFEAIGEKNHSVKAYSKLAHAEERAVHTTARHALAFHLKREKEWERAIELWKEVCEKGTRSERVEAHVELSKYYEHQEKKYTESLHHADKAHFLYDGNSRTRKEDLEKRRARLKKKMSR